MKGRSMTGFGAHERETERGTIRVEVRSLNHRYLDISLNLPPGFQSRESELRAQVAEVVKRARVDVWVSFRLKQEPERNVQVNTRLIGELHRSLEEARLSHSIPGDVGIDLLARFPEVVQVEDVGASPEDDDVRIALDQALEALRQARLREGQALLQDVAERLTRLETLCEEASRSAEASPARMAERLRERVQSLLGEVKLDPERLHQEVALLAERTDVTEELVRLRTHLKRARALIEQETEIGKPLEFLVQELGREVNTLGSKSRAPETVTSVLAMKAELEKIREQARNLE